MKRIAGYALTFIAFAFLSLSTVGVVNAQDPPATSDRELTAAAEAAAPASAPVVVPVAAPSYAPIVNSDGSFNFSPLMDGLIKFAGGVLGLVGAFILARSEGLIKEWFGIQIDTKRIAKDLGMDTYANRVADDAINYAKQQTGLKDEDLKNVEIRNPFLSMAASLVFRLDPEVWQWVSKQEQGVMKWIESKLDPAAAMPKTVVQGVGPVPPGTPGAQPAA